MRVRSACLSDGGNDTKSPAAALTLQRIHVEYSPKKRRPVYVRPRSPHGPAIASLRLGLSSFRQGFRQARQRTRHVRALGLRRPQTLLPVALVVVGLEHGMLMSSRRARQHPHVPDQGISRWRYQTRETRKKLHRFHQQMGPAPPWVLHLVRNPPIVREAARLRRDKLMG